MKLSWLKLLTQVHEKEMWKNYIDRAKNDELNNKLKEEKAGRKQLWNGLIVCKF